MQIVYILAALVIAITLHESAHALMADWLGDPTARIMGRISLNPLAHIDPLTTLAMPILLALAHLPPLAAAKPVPFNPHAVRFGRWGAALVAFAGPATNFILAVFFATWVRFFHMGVNGFLGIAVIVNVSLGIFNLIPFPPLDGSRILYAAAPPLRPLMDAIERFGIFAILILVFFGFSLIGPVISNFISIITSFLLGSNVVF